MTPTTPVLAPLAFSEVKKRAQELAPTLTRRLCAFVYEGVLLFGLIMTVALVFALVTQQRHGLSHRPGLQASLFLALAVYFIGFWYTKGQTLAMKTWHLQLVRANGMPVKPFQAACRFMTAWLWFAPSLLMIKWAAWQDTSKMLVAMSAWIAVYAGLSLLLPHRQFLHDLVCGTRLIDTRPSNDAPKKIS